MKKFVGNPYWGVFIRGANCPLAATDERFHAEQIKRFYEKEFSEGELKEYTSNLASRLIVKRCVMGRNLTQREPDKN